MENYIVLYRDIDSLPGNPPDTFMCMADNNEHAEEQCRNAYPLAIIAWVYEGVDILKAYDDYFDL